jgi:hypothetical protein
MSEGGRQKKVFRREGLTGNWRRSIRLTLVAPMIGRGSPPTERASTIDKGSPTLRITEPPFAEVSKKVT